MACAVNAVCRIVGKNWTKSGLRSVSVVRKNGDRLVLDVDSLVVVLVSIFTYTQRVRSLGQSKVSHP